MPKPLTNNQGKRYKPQADRYLKRLTRTERRYQEHLRSLITNYDLAYLVSV